jgi:hypothetical protein
MTGRYCKYALSHNNEEKYDEAITFINSVMEIFTKINVKKGWKPYQTGLLLCSQTALDFQKEYLDIYGFKFVLLSRLCQDAIENVFSQIRSRTSTPDAKQLKTSLRLISLSQMQTNVKRSNYFESNCTNVISYCRSLKLHTDLSQNHSTENSVNEEDEVCRADIEAVNSMFSFPSTSEPLTDHVQASVYYLAGTLIHKFISY